MPFTPFTKSAPKTPGTPSREPGPSPNVPPKFTKKSASKRRRKTGKVAPAQKALMSSGRSFSGGGR